MGGGGEREGVDREGERESRWTERDERGGG